MPELDAERRERLAATIGRVRHPADHSPNCWDGSPCRYCTDLADALAPLVAGWLGEAEAAALREAADAWTEGEWTHARPAHGHFGWAQSTADWLRATAWIGSGAAMSDHCDACPFAGCSGCEFQGGAR